MNRRAKFAVSRRARHVNRSRVSALAQFLVFSTVGLLGALQASLLFAANEFVHEPAEGCRLLIKSAEQHAECARMDSATEYRPNVFPKRTLEGLRLAQVGDSESGEEQGTVTLTIHVVDGQGDSSAVIENARVAVNGGDRSVHTDASGEALFENLTIGTIELRVEKEGWHPYVKEVEVTAGGQKYLVKLDPLRTTLTVTVRGVDATSSEPAPVRDCTIRVESTGGDRWEKPTSSAGTVVFKGVPRGKVLIKVIPTHGWENQILRDYQLEDEEQALPIELERKQPPSN